MGPALIEPDHRPVPAVLRRTVGAAMGPALIEPDHPVVIAVPVGCPDSPQWGRLSSSRITGVHRRVRLPQAGRNGAGSHRAGSLDDADLAASASPFAAMGPALIEPDHPGVRTG